MSLILVKYYQQVGQPTGTNPPPTVEYNPNCFTGGIGTSQPKPFTEVYIKWNGTKWLEVSTWEAAAVPALKVYNPCNGTTDLIGFLAPDFKTAQCCPVHDSGGE